MTEPLEIRVDNRIALASAELVLLRAIRESAPLPERQLREAEYMAAYERVHGAPATQRKKGPRGPRRKA